MTISKSRKITEWRAALAETFKLRLVPLQNEEDELYGEMVGQEPWASLYNYLAEVHVDEPA